MRQSIKVQQQDLSLEMRRTHRRSYGCWNVKDHAHDWIQVQDHKDAGKGVGDEGDEEENKTIGEDHFAESTRGRHRCLDVVVFAVDPSAHATQLVSSQQHDDQIECHGVYERSREDGVVR